MGRDPSSDWWYASQPAGMSIAGTYISPERAMTLSAVWAAVKIIAEGLASLPLIVYEKTGENARQRAPRHPLYDVLRWQPNASQTAYEFWEMLAGHVALRGNAYARIVDGRRGFADQLVPLHPSRVRPERVPSGAVVYQYTDQWGTPETLLADEVMHLRGLSSDGLKGLSVVEHGLTSFGAALAADQYAARFFANGATPTGVAQHPLTLSEPAQERLRTQIEAHVSGGGQHGVLVLEEGLQWQSVGFNPEQTQLLLTREFGVRDVARWFGVPLHRLADIKTPTHASIEAFGIEQVLYTFRPWAIRFEQAVRRDLILAPDRFFAEFLLTALLRGDSKARSEFYTSAIQTGWMNRNEVRELENMNPAAGLDTFLEPLNMAGAGDQRARRGSSASAPRDTRATLIAFEAAQRLVRKEVAAATKAGSRYATDGAGWSTWLREFYQEHAGHVAQALKLPRQVALDYAARQAEQLEQHGLKAMDDWEWTAATELTDAALGTADRAA
jgi:HK97 family phage portal protein